MLKENISRGNEKGSNGREIVKSKDTTLQNYSISKYESSAFQNINWFQENYPKEFEQTILKEKELTTATMLVVAKDYEKIEKSF